MERPTFMDAISQLHDDQSHLLNVSLPPGFLIIKNDRQPPPGFLIYQTDRHVWESASVQIFKGRTKRFLKETRQIATKSTFPQLLALSECSNIRHNSLLPGYVSDSARTTIDGGWRARAISRRAPPPPRSTPFVRAVVSDRTDDRTDPTSTRGAGFRSVVRRRRARDPRRLPRGRERTTT